MKFSLPLASTIALLIIILPYHANALDFSIALDNASVCPCSVFEQTATVLNDGNYRADTFSLSSDEPWARFTDCSTGLWNNRVTLLSGESAACNFVVAPPCDTPAGKYDMVLGAASETTGESSAARLTMNVLNCHSIRAEAPDVRACPGDSVLIPINVTNSGRFNETVRFASSVDGAFDNAQMSIEPGDTATNLFLYGPAPAGNRTAIVWASANSGAAASERFSIETMRCFGFNATLDAPRSLCVDRTEDVTLEITNNGVREDRYYASMDEPGSNGTEKIIIDLNASDRTVITKKITPAKPAFKTYYFTVASAATGEKRTEKADIEVLECRSFEMSVNPASQSVCKGNDANLSVTVKNTGAHEDVFNLSFMNDAEMLLLPGERRDMELRINTVPLQFGRNPVVLNISTGPLLRSETAYLNVENCYGARLSAPDVLKACPCSNKSYAIQLRNTGRVADDYAVSASGWPNTARARLQPSTSRSMTLYVTAPCEPGLYAININASSPNFFATNRTALLVTSRNCDNATESEFDGAGVAARTGRDGTAPLVAAIAIFISAIAFSIGFSRFMRRRGRKGMRTEKRTPNDKVNKCEEGG